jgi:hypothetical protein
VTAEEKTNRQGHHYTYYHCSKRGLRQHCEQPYIQLHDLEGQILEFLEEISLPDRFHQWTMARLQREFNEQKADREAQRQSLATAEAAVTRELQNLTKLRIRDMLTDEEYVSQRQDLERKQLAARQKLLEDEKNFHRFEPAKILVSLNNSLVSSFTDGDIHKKRLILNTVGSNLVLIDGKLNIDARKPFRRWRGNATFSDLRAFVKDVRTFLLQDNPNTQQLIAALETLTGKEYETSDPALRLAYKPVISPDAWDGPTISY